MKNRFSLLLQYILKIRSELSSISGCSASYIGTNNSINKCRKMFLSCGDKNEFTNSRERFFWIVISTLVILPIELSFAHNGSHHYSWAESNQILLDNPSSTFYPEAFSGSGTSFGNYYGSSATDVCVNHFVPSAPSFLTFIGAQENTVPDLDPIYNYSCVFEGVNANTGETYETTHGGVVAVCAFPPNELPVNTGLVSYQYPLGCNSGSCSWQSTACHCSAGYEFRSNLQLCVSTVEPKDCTSENDVGNPCQVSTGAKLAVETDFTSNTLSIVRSYHSLNLDNNGFGWGWHNPFLKKLDVFSDRISIHDGNGRGESWTKVNDVWVGDADTEFSLSVTNTEFVITDSRETVYRYSNEGWLLSETTAQGQALDFEYNSQERLARVVDHNGSALSFTYADETQDLVVSIAEDNGVEYQYEYDANDNLVTVIYPDSTPADNSDNPRKIYHYENPDYPNHLTGITDENGNRFGTYAYDADGKAISTEHSQTTNAVGQERFELDYQGAN